MVMRMRVSRSFRIFAWSLYDLSNTSFSALFVTFFFPLYVKEYLGGTEFQIGLSFGISMLLVGLLVPFIGAISDQLKRRMPFIVFFTILSCIFSVLVITVGLSGALLFGLLANFCYHACLGLYNALLPSLSTSQTIGKISGFGTALGYVGTLTSLGAAYILFRFVGFTREGILWMFPLTAILFFVPSLITFFWAEPPVLHRKKFSYSLFFETCRDAFNELRETVCSLKSKRSFLWFLLSVFMTTNAITAVIIFLFLYGREVIGLSIPSFMGVYGVFSLGAALGAWIFGKITDRLGPKSALILDAAGWIITVCLLLATSTFSFFLFSGVIGGISLGGFWTAQRPLLVRLAPRHQFGQYFGLLELSGKYAGVFGPAIFGWFATTSYTHALLSLLVFFVVGLGCLLFVRR